MSEEILNELRNAIMDLDGVKSKAVAHKGINAGLEPLDLINNGTARRWIYWGSGFRPATYFYPSWCYLQRLPMLRLRFWNLSC